MVSGKNNVELQGLLRFPQGKETRNGHFQFTGKIAVPFSYHSKKTNKQEEGMNYVPICAWGDLAQSMSELPDGTAIQVRGVYNSRSYEGNCKSCGEVQKQTWTDVLVNNYTLVDE